MGKSVNYFIYFIVAVYTLSGIRFSAGQWEKCEGNRKLTNRLIWKCVKKTECVHVKKIPTKSTIICGQDALCCPELKTNQTSLNTSNPATAFERANNIALEKCNKYAQYRFLNYTEPSPNINEPDILKSELQCERLEVDILNGSPAKLNEYAHMALLGYDKDVTDPTKWLCGGSLISEQFILSAAHCTKSGRGTEVQWAALGLLSREDITADLVGKNLFQIVQRFNHPEYQPGKAYNDIALYKLDHPIEFSPTIRPICIHHLGNLKNNDETFITGWGRTSSENDASTVLLEAIIRYLHNDLCTRNYQDEKILLPKGFKPSTMICGGDLSGKNDTCGGDSGGPMQIKMPETDCMWIQVGITSIGPAFCGDAPAIYTRVSYYLPWIQKLVWPEATNGKRPS